MEYLVAYKVIERGPGLEGPVVDFIKKAQEGTWKAVGLISLLGTAEMSFKCFKGAVSCKVSFGYKRRVLQ